MHIDIVWLNYGLLVVAAIGAGMVNAIAGGGSFLTFPALVYTGVPPVTANASNTVALVPSIFLSTLAYRNDMRGIEKVPMWVMVAVALAGGVAGALLLLHTPQHIFDFLIPWLLGLATLLFAFGKQLTAAVHRIGRVNRPTLVCIQFVLAIYGGYFGGAVGFLMLALFGLFGLTDLHAMNGLKTLMAGLMNGAAVVIFLVAGGIVWHQTLVMLIAAMFGSYAGARMARKIDQKALRLIIVTIGTVITVAFALRH
jgi:uncharacterized membrane protein YfcA